MSQFNDAKTVLLEDRTKQTSNLSVEGQPRRRRRVFIASVACGVVITAVLVITLAITLSSSPRGGGDCITPDVCNSNILNYINNNFDPCDDFFSYSCGNWLSANPLNGRSMWGTLNELAVDNYKHISEYLTRPVQNNDPDAIKKSKYIYSACTDVQFIQKNYVKHLQDFIKNAGGWADIGIIPDKGWDINNNLANDHFLGSTAFFTWRVELDDLNSSKPVIRVCLSCTSVRLSSNCTQNSMQTICISITCLKLNKAYP